MASTVWRGRLTLGMVSIPIRLYKAARRERIAFHHVRRQEATDESQDSSEEPAGREEPDEPSKPFFTNSNTGKSSFSKSAPPAEPAPPAPQDAPVVRVHNSPTSLVGPSSVSDSPILKGFEIEPDRYVVFQPEELKALRPKTSTELAIVEFVKFDQIDPIYLDVSYYVAPDKDVGKPYSLLYAALKKSGLVAIGALAMHGREHAAVIRAGEHGIILHTMFYGTEVRTTEQYRTPADNITPKELGLATQLVTAMQAEFDPFKFKDTLEERLHALIESRAQTTARDVSTSPPSKAPVVDIMDALRKSLAALAKPPSRELHVSEAKAPAGNPRRRHAR